jgi:hypothetical protein
LTLGGCGPEIVYDYTPPQSPEGRTCAAQCANTKQYCRQSAESSYQSCQSNYQLGMANYNACKQAGGTLCSQPSSCVHPYTGGCDEAYRSCFAACGGQVQTRVVK